MKNLKFRVLMLAISAGAVALQLGNCAKFWGDVVGDSLILSIVD